MSDAVTWLDVLVLLAAYLVASLAWKAVERLQAARSTFDAITDEAECPFCDWPAAPDGCGHETGGEAAPDPQDGESVDPSRAVCNDPAASPPSPWPAPGWLICTDPTCPDDPLNAPHAHTEIRLEREHVVRGDR